MGLNMAITILIILLHTIKQIFIICKKYEPLEKYKKSTIKNEYDYLYRNKKVNGKKLQNYELIHE